MSGFAISADELDVSHFTVSKWVRRFALYGVRSLSDAPRSGVPRTHGDDKIAEIIKLNEAFILPEEPD
jgi:transposase